ncbi:MAG: hypothetical protein K2O14_10850 [Oscillospiraceae bacterium]|nr:hypothetical protein [Oscillospiraceae bacterium]
MKRSELLERAKPILFNTDMVRAIQDGRKTVTRRVLKPQPYEECIGENIHEFVKDSDLGGEFTGFVCRKCGCGVCAPHSKYPVGTSWIRPKYKVSDILYVRETWCKGSLNYGEEQYYYKADNKIPHCQWNPSIHMPKEAARIFLRVTSIRLERLQDCGNMQAKDEGCNCCSQFVKIWDSTIKKSDRAKYGWAANPWVWVIEFERVEAT